MITFILWSKDHFSWLSQGTEITLLLEFRASLRSKKRIKPIPEPSHFLNLAVKTGVCAQSLSHVQF